ncbi:conserved hypothetical protein [Tenacibaculum maritimum]|uniref:hypothetical protein n=1 Tax=Tenacibaculum maritimum TaxID=107401 RepID=UPI0012E61C0C|nr:hypothetical protein [Tenacibaculum maritimum]CAA0211415.1 conserved hypothetical protein [Tenacibaculum maritimum]
MKNIDYDRLLELKRLIKNGNASKKDKKEYMTLLYKNGNITNEQYEKFLGEKSDNDVINAALTIGGVLLATWLLTKLFNKE